MKSNKNKGGAREHKVGSGNRGVTPRRGLTFTFREGRLTKR